ncbi:MAG: AI-2E family transporter [Microbacteriaceae bacterium]
MKIQNVFRTALVGTLGVGAGLLIWGAVASLATIITYAGAAIFLALGLDPVVRWMERRGLPRWLAILTVVVVIIAVAAGIVLLLIPVVAAQVTALVNGIAGFANNTTFEAWLGQAQAWVNQFTNTIDIRKMVDDAAAWLSDPGNLGSIGGGILSVGIGVATGVFGAIVVLVLTIYFTASLGGIKRSLYQLVPASRRAQVADLTEQISDSVGRYVIGQIALGLTNGTLSFIFLTIIQAPFPALLAVVAFFFSLIPLVGSLIGSTIIILISLLLGGPLTALVAAIYYIAYMQVEAYLISPTIMKRAVSVPGAVVVLAALAGGTLLGLLGALIAIPVAAAVLLVIKQVVIPHQNEL